MFKNKIGFALKVVLSIVQILAIVAAVVLEGYSSKRMGVARYLIYKKQMFEDTLFTSTLINVYLLIFLLGGMICLIFFIVNMKLKNKRTTIHLFWAMIANFAGLIFILVQFNLSAYYFFIIAIMMVIAIQYIKMLF